ncbi:MAG: class I SAM-dependent methyltransferase [Candidatus Aminicenantes bacterium]|nr:MAG: class I SAM-dependent methyltransferase [Candidatus Aminicenantes bacterium]
MQDKSKERNFFDTFSSAREYDVFTAYGYKTLIGAYLKLMHVPVSSKIRVIDLGCGSGAFARKFKEIYGDEKDFFGLDISERSVSLGAELAPGIHFCAGDIEQCCFKDESFDILLFSGVLHHFSDFEPCLEEGYRILKNGGCVLSYDPNIRNPFMWLYRHPSSPFFSKKGKTDNERLLSTGQIGSALKKVGFTNVITFCISGVTFKYVASVVGRLLLPVYNLLEILLGISPLASKYGSFIIGYGEKREAGNLGK